MCSGKCAGGMGSEFKKRNTLVMKLNVYARFCTILFTLSISFSSAAGVGIIDGSAGVYMKMISSDVQVTVNNQIATIKVTEVFKNTSTDPVNFKYGFPLPEKANPTSLKWYYQGNWYQAYMNANTQNNDIPGSGGGGGGGGALPIDPALEAYLGDSPLFFSPQDTIPPDSLYTIELTYVELLTYEMGLVLFHLTHDLTGLQNDPVTSQSFSFELVSDRPIVDANLIGVTTNDFIDTYYATLAYNLVNQPANFDLNLEYELYSNAMGVIPFSIMMPDSLYNCDSSGDGYATLIVEPRPYVDTDVMPKNFTLIIDKSGSMYGVKMQEAKDAATYILNNLNPGDYFNIVSFASSAYSAFPQHVAFNPANAMTGHNFINAITASGGTNIDGAMTEAIGQYVGVAPGMANIVLFLTDGMGSSTNQATLDLVADEVAATGVDIYINTIAVGYGANEELMVMMAEENGGLSLFIEEEAIEDEIISFFNMINNPVLLNTTITFTPDILYEIHPSTIPNLYQGQQMIFSARYDSAEVVTMHLAGEAFGLPVSYDFMISLSDSADPELVILPKIWAKQKLDDLEIQYYQTGSQVLQDEIDSLSLCYQVLDVQFGSFEGGELIGLEEELVVGPDQLEINAYPQPFHSYLTLTIPSSFQPEESLTIEILDLAGKVVYSEVVLLTGNQVTIDDLDRLKEGTYILRVSGADGMYTGKVVKV
jgi:Ca-activated chloride channel homolog